MYKIIGSILIILATTGMGFSKSNEMKQHLKELEELKKVFYLIRSELQYTRAPFAELFLKVSQKTSAPFRNWLADVSTKLCEKQSGMLWDIWCTSIETHFKDSRLKDEELEALKQVGRNPEYIESLDLYIAQLEYEMEHTRECYRTKRKLCQSLGIMSGIFLVILLL